MAYLSELRDWVRAHRLPGIETDGAKLIVDQIDQDSPDQVTTHLVLDQYSHFVDEYLRCCAISDLPGIWNLVNAILEDTPDHLNGHLDARLEIRLIEACQEIATRQESWDALEQVMPAIVAYAERHAWDADAYNQRGLLLRRMDERKEAPKNGVSFLRQSATSYLRARECSGQLSLEIGNNWAITLIRCFEATRDASYLDQAQTILTSLVSDTRASFAFQDLVHYPKAINNLGNLYKQRLILYKEPHWYSLALETYQKCEKHWTELGSPYDWAMVQKNKADVRCAYIEIYGLNREIAQMAVQEIDSSMKYRSQEAAPYQYQRSLQVKQKLQAMLNAC